MLSMSCLLFYLLFPIKQFSQCDRQTTLYHTISNQNLNSNSFYKESFVYDRMVCMNYIQNNHFLIIAPASNLKHCVPMGCRTQWNALLPLTFLLDREPQPCRNSVQLKDKSHNSPTWIWRCEKLHLLDPIDYKPARLTQMCSSPGSCSSSSSAWKVLKLLMDSHDLHLPRWWNPMKQRFSQGSGWKLLLLVLLIHIWSTYSWGKCLFYD